MIGKENHGQMRMNKSLFPDTHLAEAYAALHFVLLEIDIGLSKIILEGDAFNVVKEINGGGDHWGQAWFDYTRCEEEP